jgi:fumarate hydratase class II
MSCGPRAGFAEFEDPRERARLLDHAGQGEPDPGRGADMIAVQVMANDVAVGFGGAGGYLEMNVYKAPLSPQKQAYMTR